MDTEESQSKDSKYLRICLRITVVVVGLFATLNIAIALVEFGLPIDYPVQDNPISIDQADLDQDGDNDLIVANLYSDSVSVLRNNGDGSFALAAHYSVGTGPHSLKAGDLDNDGDVDVATANYWSNNVSVLLNDGGGTLLNGGDFPVGVPGETSTESITLGDFDRNGFLDLAVTNVSFAESSANTVAVLTNNGDGTFPSATDYPIGLTGPHAVTTADTDQDGDLDLAVTNRDHSSVFVYSNNGDGTFSDPTTLTGVITPDAIIGADVDRDTDIDLVTAGFDGGVSVFRNDGGGTFSSPDTTFVQGHPISLADGDFDQDGYLDMVVANFSPDEASDQPVALLLGVENGALELEVFAAAQTRG